MNLMKRTTLVALVCLLTGVMRAQTPSDAVMMNPGEICIDLHYGHSAWDEYWEGDSLRDNGNIGTLNTSIYGTGFMLGLINRVNLLASLPYVVTNPTGRVISGDKGIQDASFYLKGLLVEQKLGKGTFKTLASIGISLPAGDYVPDAPFAIGLGCPDGIFRGILHYDADMGLYGRVDAGYHLRGSAYLDRTYYYTTQAYYSDQVDMPNATDYNVTVGYITKNKHFKAEAVYGGLTTFDGFDIRRQDGGFPSNDMEMSRVGVNLEYYDLFVKGLAIHAGGGMVLTGSNVGKSTMFGGAISYQFPLWDGRDNKKSETPEAK